MARLEPHQPRATGFKASLGHRRAWPCHPGPIGQPTEGSGAQRLRLLVKDWGWAVWAGGELAVHHPFPWSRGKIPEPQDR